VYWLIITVLIILLPVAYLVGVNRNRKAAQKELDIIIAQLDAFGDRLKGEFKEHWEKWRGLLRARYRV